ncbi:ornithine cyclodeaminase/mu-crystallin [Micromonospora sp. ATCC 39149]|uniref:2 n=1 Tax=Micromonospora carbonacea TaxID=47853 RepID=A0A7D6GSP1_9ACTN|nr:2,3-diaminopropionate biosynthesis protein SbnB [Micromonospora sp. ATCC 39149]EEP74895.1 ornithine cyclodeaminase/mu-crystallin [Micromonospora sp. ATCC 39149]QLK00652.1 2 [Micromonospora carbonacea] [Micromonospora carbonacea]
MLILGAGEVRAVLDGAEREVVAAVDSAYRSHALGRTQVPQSVFLRFPNADRERIIALPAFLGGATPTCGVKWVSSFPDNLRRGMHRASAVMILNSVHTGVPEAILEASAISAGRTAASAALAASTLSSSSPETAVTLVGCGPINFEVLRYLQTVLPTVDTVTLYDLSAERAQSFAAEARSVWPTLQVDVAESAADALARHKLVCLATTASAPHLGTEHCRPGTLVLHLSLRDLTTDSIHSSVNIVDDADHVCRAATSLDLAQQEAGHRDFISSSLGHILVAGERYVRSDDAVTVFSPFGLGCLDLAVADVVRHAASARGLGTTLDDFLPTKQQVFA